MPAGPESPSEPRPSRPIFASVLSRIVRARAGAPRCGHVDHIPVRLGRRAVPPHRHLCHAWPPARRPPPRRAPPPAPPVTAAQGRGPRRHRMERVHRPPRSRAPRRRAPARVGPDRVGALHRRRGRPPRRPAVRDRPAAVPGRGRSAARGSGARPGRVRPAPPPSASAPQRLSAENAMSAEEHDRRASSAAEAEAQVSAVEAALRSAELNLEFTRVDRADRRPRRPGDRHRGQPGVERAGRGHAAHDAGLARSDLRLVRGGRAVVPRVPARGGGPAAARRGAGAAGIRMALAGEAEFPREGRLQFLDNQLDAATGTIRVRAVFANADGALTPGLFVRLRMTGGPPVSGGAGPGPGDRHRPRQALRLRRRRGRGDCLPAGDARPDRGRPARRAQRPRSRTSSCSSTVCSACGPAPR